MITKKFLPISILSLTLFVSNPLQGAAVLQENDLVAVCGDSITEQRLYSLYIQQYLMLCQPQKNLMAMQFGWGGETAEGFLKRLENDVLVFKPTVATLCYGMNDGRYSPVTDGGLAKYRQNLSLIIEKLKQGEVRTIVVGSPGVVDTKSFNRPNATAQEYNKTLAAFRDVAREVAEAQGLPFADVHSAMNSAMVKAKEALGEGYLVAGDGVHPGSNGQLPMAYAFLKALGCDGEIGTLEVDWSGQKATATEGHRVKSFQAGVLDVESSRYPFCFPGQNDGRGLRTIVPYIPFNDELNRFLLVVKGAPARVKVKWGAEEKEFTAAQLEKGINLAAEFLDNPFLVPFQNASKAMSKQQGDETLLVKGMLNPMMNWKRVLPEGSVHYDELSKIIIAKSESGRAASREGIVPVDHQVVISAVQ